MKTYSAKGPWNKSLKGTGPTPSLSSTRLPPFLAGVLSDPTPRKRRNPHSRLWMDSESPVPKGWVFFWGVSFWKCPWFGDIVFSCFGNVHDLENVHGFWKTPVQSKGMGFCVSKNFFSWCFLVFWRYCCWCWMVFWAVGFQGDPWRGRKPLRHGNVIWWSSKVGKTWHASPISNFLINLFQCHQCHRQPTKTLPNGKIRSSFPSEKATARHQEWLFF